MFAIHSIELTNFKSYQGTHSFEFPEQHGLYFFAGSNLVDDLGSNGAGKSTLIDAITWALYGRTARGLKANDIITWGAASCVVTLKVTIGQHRFQVQRTQKPNGLFLGDKPVDQDELEKHIRLNFEAFLHSVLNAQFGQSFFSLAPSAKLTLFSDIMGLDFWLQKSEEANTVTKQLIEQIDALRLSIASKEGKVVTIKDDIMHFEQTAKAFQDDKLIKITWKEQELKSAMSNAVTLSDKITEISGRLQSKLKALEGLQDHHVNDLTKYVRERAATVAKVEHLNEQVKDYKALGSTCPTCHQPVSKAHVKHEVDELLIEAETLDWEAQAIDADIEMMKKLIVQNKSKMAGIIDEINETKDKRAEVKVWQSKIEQIKVEIKELKQAENPYTALITHKRVKLKELKASAAVDTATLQTADADHASNSFWIKGFKRVRLFIIEQAFRTLEIEVNNSLASLGMHDWQITFDIERENKGGGITKGFVVFVKSPRNKEPVRWEAWSGGETQRLQLAGDLGLANLIMTQAGLCNTIELYDEPSTHLSPEGMMDLANLLHERAVSEGKCIWIVDHAAITNFGDFEGLITARKDANGSTISFTKR